MALSSEHPFFEFISKIVSLYSDSIINLQVSLFDICGNSLIRSFIRGIFFNVIVDFHSNSSHVSRDSILNISTSANKEIMLFISMFILNFISQVVSKLTTNHDIFIIFIILMGNNCFIQIINVFVN